MALVVQDGYWQNPSWRDGSPGIFAVVVGVSAYEKLNGSDKSYFMGPLASSALTAFRVFQWLDRDHLLTECPVAKVWMLLAATPAEVAVEPAIPSTDPPTLENVRRAVRQWRMAMRDLETTSLASSQESIGCFFFSGHGLEIQSDRQVLLPMDYLKDEGQVDDAIPTANLREGNADLHVKSLFLFLDACRNDNSALRERGVKGSEILSPIVGVNANPDFCCQHVYATSTSLEAYQRRDPARGISIFGEALLEGLKGIPDMKLADEGSRQLVKFDALQQYLKRRVPALVHALDPRATQKVKVNGTYDDYALAEVPPPIKGTISATLPSLTVSMEAKVSSPLLISVDAAMAAAIPFDWNVAHTVFGHESVTDFIQKLLIYDLVLGAPLGLEVMTISQVERAADDFRYRIDFSLKTSSPVWIVDARIPQMPICAVVPLDRNGSVPYRLDVTFGDRRNQVLDMEVGFAPVEHPEEPMQNWSAEAEKVWTHYELGNRQLSQRHADDLVKIAENKVEASLPATLALGLLVQHGLDRNAFGWPRNLMNWFPRIPDGPSIWLAQLIRYQPGNQGEIQSAVDEMGRRGLPLFTPSFELAVSALDTLSKMQLAPSIRDKARQIQARFELAARNYRSGGQFVTLAGEGAQELATTWDERLSASTMDSLVSDA